MLLRRAGVVVLVLLVAGCGGGGGGGKTLAQSKAKELVLQPSDLPAGFAQYGRGQITAFDVPTGPRRDLERFGRIGGWKAQYRRSGAPATRGALIVESVVDLFGGSDGAKRDLDAYRKQFEPFAAAPGGGAKVSDLTGLGDGAVVLSQVQTGSPTTHYFTIAWRHGSVTASVAVTGFTLALADAEALARTQDRKLAAALR